MSRRLLESLTVHDSDSNSSDDDSPKKAPLEKVHCPSRVCSNMLTSNSSPTKTSTIPTAYRSPVTVLRDITNMKVLDSKENSDDDTSSSNIAVIPFIEQPLPDYYDMSTEDLSVMQTIDNLSITEPMVDYSTNNTDTGIKEIDNDNEEKIIAYEADIIGDIIEKGQNKLTGVTCHMPNNIVIDANESNRIQLTSDRVGYVGRDIEVKHNYESCELLAYQTPPSTSNCRSTPFYTSPLPVSSTKSLTNASNRRKRGSSIMFLISPKDLSSTEIASLSNLNEEDMPNRDNDVDCKLFSGKVDEFTPRFSVCHVSDFRRSKYHTDVNRCHNPAASASIPFPPSIRGSNGMDEEEAESSSPLLFRSNSLDDFKHAKTERYSCQDDSDDVCIRLHLPISPAKTSPKSRIQMTESITGKDVHGSHRSDRDFIESCSISFQKVNLENKQDNNESIEASSIDYMGQQYDEYDEGSNLTLLASALLYYGRSTTFNDKTTSFHHKRRNLCDSKSNFNLCDFLVGNVAIDRENFTSVTCSSDLKDTKVLRSMLDFTNDTLPSINRENMTYPREKCEDRGTKSSTSPERPLKSVIMSDIIEVQPHKFVQEECFTSSSSLMSPSAPEIIVSVKKDQIREETSIPVKKFNEVSHYDNEREVSSLVLLKTEMSGNTTEQRLKSNSQSNRNSLSLRLSGVLSPPGDDSVKERTDDTSIIHQPSVFCSPLQNVPSNSNREVTKHTTLSNSVDVYAPIDAVHSCPRTIRKIKPPIISPALDSEVSCDSTNKVYYGGKVLPPIHDFSDNNGLVHSSKKASNSKAYSQYLSDRYDIGSVRRQTTGDESIYSDSSSYPITLFSEVVDIPLSYHRQRRDTNLFDGRSGKCTDRQYFSSPSSTTKNIHDSNYYRASNEGVNSTVSTCTRSRSQSSPFQRRYFIHNA